MQEISDEELLKEVAGRLGAKDRACRDLMVVNRKLKALNEKLVESERLKTNFLSNIRNEINNPLTSVLTMCEILSELLSCGSLDTDTVRSAVETIHREAFSLNFQLRNIFAAADLEAGSASVNASEVDLGRLLDGVARSFAKRGAEKGVTVEVDTSALGERKLFRTDPEKLELAVVNLISNAIEFSNDNSRVDVSARLEGGTVQITFTDRGIGIAPWDQGAIFERFRQLDSGSTKRHGGHGLGLSITKAAVELLGGWIKVESRPNEGARFTVCVPEAAPAQLVGSTTTDGASFFFDDAGSERF